MMMYTERANLLLSELSQYLDGEHPVLDESNYAFIWLSDMLFSFTLAGEDEGEKRDILCVVHICPFPYCDDGTAYDLLLRLLHDNHAWSNTGEACWVLMSKPGLSVFVYRLICFPWSRMSLPGESPVFTGLRRRGRRV